MPSRRSTSWRTCAACATTSSAQIDALLLPTVPTVYTVEQVLADPIGLNSRLGTYTNFVNLLDLCGLAVPASHASRRHAVRRHAAGARPGSDARSPRSGACSMPTPACRSARPASRSRRCAHFRHIAAAGELAIAVVGAHLSGMPLNGELKSLGARLLESAHDRARLSALCARPAHAAEARPAARRAGRGRRDRGRDLGAAGRRLRPLRRRGAAAAVDRHADAGRRPHRARASWSRPRRSKGARDISSFGGWRAFVEQAKISA